MKVNAYLEITMKIDAANRPAAARVYTDYREPFRLSGERDVPKRCLCRAQASVECRSGGTHLYSCITGAGLTHSEDKQ